MSVFPWRGYNGPKAYADLVEGDLDRETFKARLLGVIEPRGFKWRIFAVAASGFLADSYAIFSTNVVSPALAYVYWQNDTSGTKGLVINVVTLAGSCIGMVSFGFLADLFGRKRLYGVELIIGIVATLGLTQVSAGYNQDSMSAFAWLVWWRWVLGVAIGAECPLSALIASEWSATKTRGTMLAAVFLMQPVGQFLAYIIGYGALQGIFHSRLPNWSPSDWDDPIEKEKGKAAIDAVWRCVIGVGAFPALVAIFLRLTIPETPRYLVDVDEDLPAAAKATRKVFPKKNDTPSRQNSDKSVGSEANLVQNSNTNATVQGYSRSVVDSELTQRNGTNISPTPVYNMEMEPNPHVQNRQQVDANTNRLLRSVVSNEEQDRRSVQSGKKEDDKEAGFWDDWHKTYKKGQGFRRMLAAVCVCWFIMDVCFYGFGLDTPRTLAKVFAARPEYAENNTLYDWQAGFASEDNNIFDVMVGDSTRALYAIPISAILGSVVFLLSVNYISRVVVLRWTFAALGVLFGITGSSFIAVFQTSHHSLAIAFYSIALFILNFGPNTILFMLPAELFPTRYRGTCYGIAAASGKAGAIVIQLIVHFQKITRPSSGKMRLAIMLICFTPLMFIGALIAWFWIPDVQHPIDPKLMIRQPGLKDFRKRQMMPPRSLEEITANPSEDQLFGLRDHLRHLLPFRRKKDTSASV